MRKSPLTSLISCFLFSIIFIAAGCAKKAPIVPPADEKKAEEMKSEQGLLTLKETEERTYEADTSFDHFLRERGEEEPVKEFKEMMIASVPQTTFESSPSLATIHFDFDKYNIKPDDRIILNQNAAWLRLNPGRVKIEGHCDERGTSEYNLALADKRANATKNYLVSLGINSSRISTISYGEERPLCSEKMESCWSQNRRAQFLMAQ